MKYFIVFFALIVVAFADVSHLEMTTTEQPAQDHQEQSDLSPAASSFDVPLNREYLPPLARSSDPFPAHTFGADGYTYKQPVNRFFY
ncbi:unnamed protein product [Hermetia illucens]|uniref:Uncharacterized protein n=1 Tax=Hermetia illucens TaxID=343691 RepID=A0A7R8UIT4_HERIL|nr:unnamed protein product [Hermetia illucens]